MINVTNAVKQAYEHSTRQRDKIILNGTEYDIINVEYIDDVYIEGNVYGTAIARQLSFEIPRCNIENQEFEYLNGIEVDGTMQWISLGNFITQDVQEGEVSGIIKVEALDYMIKSNVVYESNLPYGSGNVKIYDVALEACQQIGITLATNTLTNGNFIVDSNQFSEGTLVRQVIQAVAQISGSVAKIKSDNKLYFINPNQVASISKVFDNSNYYELDTKRYTHPINTVVLGMADIEGENVVMRDEQAVERDGEIRIVFNDNPFAYNEEKRTELITALFNSIKGFEYRSYELKGQALPYLETLDKVQLNIEEYGELHLYNSYVFRLTYKSPNGLDSITEAPSIINAMVNYENVIGAQEIAKRTEVIVDKQNQQIESVISTQTEQNKKIARVVQTVDELNSKISDIADVTTSLETNTARLEFEKINESEPVRVVIRPIGVNISYLYPSPILHPSNNLYFKVRILRFENTDEETIVDYILPDDLLYYDADNYDEFILDYDAHTCIVNKKCKWNSDGTVGLLDTPRTDEYEYPTIPLTNGDYIVSLVNYNNAYLFARLMVQNIYTTQFATKAEIGSQISQTAQNINLSVDTKLSNYSTTTQMNSAINVKATEITSSVSENYATKETLNNNYSTTEQTANMISTTVSQAIKNNLEEVTVEYALGTSTTTAPTSGWSTTAPTWQQGKYMWQRTKTKTADGTESTSNPTCIAGAKGQDGTNGVSISSITEYYAVSSSNSTAPADSAFKTTMQTMTATNKYLWNYEVINFSNGTTQNTNKRVIGTYGDKGQAGTDGTNGVGISNIVNKYAVSSSNTTAPSSWSNTPQTMTATNKYLWNYEIITYSNNTTYTSTPAVIGTYGEKGNTGDTGKGVKAVVAQYYLSSSKTSQTGGSWSETQPTYKKDYYYWTRTKITWTDDTTTYTTPILVEEINSLNESVAKLEITAGNISTEVSKKVGNNEIISKINQSAEAVTIKANKININGTVSANGNFKVDTAGNMTATSATLTNATIKSNSNDSSITMQSGNIITKDEDGNRGVEIIKQGVNIYSFNDADNFVGALCSDERENYLGVLLYSDHGDGLSFGVRNKNSEQVGVYLEMNYQNSNAMKAFVPLIMANDIRMNYGRSIQFYDNSTMRGEIYLSTGGNIIVPLLYSEAPTFAYSVGGGHYEGTPLISTNGHILFAEWSGTALNFFVDSTYVGTLSDKRLKKDITEIDDRLIKAVAECKLYQFKADNRNGLMSVGIMAQDFQANCKKYEIQPEDYEIFKKITYNLNDKTVYYSIDYEQYLIIKNKYLEDKVKEQEDRLNRLEEKINGLYKNNVE